MDDPAVRAWEEAGAVNPQMASPLYNGRIPAEIRMLIWELALADDVGPTALGYRDWRVKDNHDVDRDSDIEDGEAIELDDADYGGDVSQNEAIVSFQDDSEHGDENEDDSEHEDENEDDSEHEDENEDDSEHEDEDANESQYQDEEYDSEDQASASSSFDGFSHVGYAVHRWDRPDASGPPAAPPPLLRVCRRTYMELTESRMCHQAWPKLVLFGRRGPSQRPIPPSARPRHARFYTQMFWLEDTFYRYISLNARTILGTPSVLDKLRDLRLTFRRGDWWNNEINDPLHIDPFGTDYEDGLNAIRRMIREQPTASRGHAFLPSDSGAIARDLYDCYLNRWTDKIIGGGGAPMLFPDQSWALAFAQLPSLENLTIDFETAPNKRNEMDLIVDWAVGAWIFPMYVHWRHDGSSARLDRTGGEVRERFLAATGNPVGKTSWRGLPQHYSQGCPSAGGHGDKNSCGYCEVRKRREAKNVGPRLLMWTARWTPRQALEDGTEIVFREVVAAPGPVGPALDPRDDGTWMRQDSSHEARRLRRWGFRPRRNAAEVREACLVDDGEITMEKGANSPRLVEG